MSGDITRLVPYFGANAAHAEAPSRMLRGAKWVYIPCAGSMTEVRHFSPGVQLMVSDVHEELITLARMVANAETKAILAQRLARNLFHPAELERARGILHAMRQRTGLFGNQQRVYSDLDIAEAYFVVAWMGRSAVAGTTGEESVGLAVRYDAGGGDPAVRYRSAVAALEAWHETLYRCVFSCESIFDVITRLTAKVTHAKFDPTKPGNRIGIYVDAPWPDAGDGYLHAFTETEQASLAGALSWIPRDRVRVCLRYGDHPLIRKLYPESAGWVWHEQRGRAQTNGSVREVLIVRGGDAWPEGPESEAADEPESEGR